MRPLDLDFTRSAPRPPWTAWLIAALGLGALALAGWQWQLASSAQEQAQRQLAALQRATHTGPKRPQPKAQTEGAAAVTQAALELQAPWSERLRTLEQRRPARIALISIETDAAKGALLITAEARDRRAMLEYFAAMQRAPGLGDVVLASHEVIDDQGQRPVRFVLKGRWQ